MVVCDLEPEWSARLVARVTATLPGTADTEMLIIDAQGQPVSASPSIADGRVPADLDSLLKTGVRRWGQMPWPDGEDYITAIASDTSWGPIAELGWRVVVRRLSVAAMQPALALRDKVYEFSAIVVLLAAVIGAIAAHLILRPLQRIAVAARRIGDGELGVHIPELRTYREVEILSRSLHAMLATLRANESRLASMNEGLDQRVRQRTAEIAEAHEEMARQRSRLRAVIDTAMDGVRSSARKTASRFFNPACERIFGWKAEEIVGRLSTELVATENRTLRGNQLPLTI